MPKIAIEYEASRTEIDGETGEVLKHEQSTELKRVHQTEPPYIKLYIQDILYLHDMPKGLTEVMYALLTEAQYASKGLRVYLPAGLKREIIEQLGTTKAVFNNALSKLCKGNIIRREDSGVYSLNPYFFGRGEWIDIDNIRATWNYDAIKGRTFQAAIIKRNGEVEITGEKSEND